MLPFRRFLERVGFHLPYSHDWLVERNALRNKSMELAYENDRLRSEADSVRSRLSELEKALWQPPGHFYSPIPDARELAEHKERLFGLPSTVPDVDFRDARQLELLQEFGGWYADQPFTPTKRSDRRYYFENENYSYTDAIILYCMLRHVRPRRFVEVGSGFSSCAALDVNDLLFEGKIDCTFIDPYPELLLKLLTDEDRSRQRILGQRVQDVSDDVFQELRADDILFIDSSHVAKTGSDVHYLFFHVLPLLAPGVYIHVHDIFYPFEYPEGWALQGRAWNEAYLLHAFLAHNRCYEIQFFITYLLQRYPGRIEAEFPLFKKAVGGSIWFRKGETARS